MPGLSLQARLAPSSFAWHGTAQEAMTKVCVLYAAVASCSCLLPLVLSARNLVLYREASFTIHAVCDGCVVLCSYQHRRQQRRYNEVGIVELSRPCKVRVMCVREP